jgi:uncharacterized protein YceK
MKRILIALLIIGALTGCSTTNQAVYKHGKSWTKMPAKSAMTGWTYTK